MDGGELFDRILHLNYDPTELDVCIYMKQICEGVSYLHKNQILHLDLKVRIVFDRLVINRNFSLKISSVLVLTAIG